MNINTARNIIETQRRQFRKLHNLRWVYRNSSGRCIEYCLRYEGGFSEFFGIYWRELGRRKFNYWHGFGASGMRNNSEVIAHINKLFPKEVIS